MIPQQEIVDKITQIVQPIAQESSLELVDVEFRTSGKRWLLRVYIDREGGVTIEDCVRVSRELSRTLDVEDVIEHPYALEVSSPGLTRALKKKADFERSKGRQCKIITTAAIEGRVDFRGEILGIAGDNVEVKEKGDTYRIPLTTIKKASLELEL
jgi:ribosome maturation factor RimP